MSPAGFATGCRPKIVVESSLRALSFFDLVALIENMPSPKREQGLAVVAAKRKFFADEECKPCAENQVAAALRVWYQMNKDQSQ